ncbi:hypothetical protein PAXINDRAFT_156681 [Paxillus involutus ATCC 200175]|uniref:Uncharacterized protein n=1 Tax=Paxillus involutus ATCC 200175 TaxID=664439 RepID=A0A0C9TR94_PAXIN|nr:hypothetical protein PAXINDRAFT_156681 [Paxillus involutus ATCC 200175]
MITHVPYEGDTALDTSERAPTGNLLCDTRTTRVTATDGLRHSTGPQVDQLCRRLNDEWGLRWQVQPAKMMIMYTNSQCTDWNAGSTRRQNPVRSLVVLSDLRVRELLELMLSIATFHPKMQGATARASNSNVSCPELRKFSADWSPRSKRHRMMAVELAWTEVLCTKTQCQKGYRRFLFAVSCHSSLVCHGLCAHDHIKFNVHLGIEVVIFSTLPTEDHQASLSCSAGRPNVQSFSNILVISPYCEHLGHRLEPIHAAP